LPVTNQPPIPPRPDQSPPGHDEEDEEEVPMRFEVTHHLPGQDDPAHTMTDAAGVAALVQQAATTGTRVYIRPATRPETPDSKPATA
jgi:hypothetical protein